MTYSIQRAEAKELPEILLIYTGARKFMAEKGNPNQWGMAYPPEELLQRDISEGALYVVRKEETIHGVFYFRIGIDPTYAVIYNGTWGADCPYGVIHRIAGDGSHGILRSAVEYCMHQINYLRIDTHEDNRIMQHALEKLGFQRRGMIYIEDGTARIAYDLHA